MDKLPYHWYTDGMKVRVLLLCAAVLALAACRSNRNDGDAEKSDVPLPYVNTGADLDGKVFSVRVFSEITEVSVYDLATHDCLAVLPAESWRYDPVTTEVSLLNYTAPEDAVFHVEGRQIHPDTYVLAGYDGSRCVPGVFLEGKPAAEGTDYTFDPDTARLTFSKSIDMEKISYTIVWLTAYSMNGMADHTKGEEAVYDQLVADWLAAQPQ